MGGFGEGFLGDSPSGQENDARPTETFFPCSERKILTLPPFAPPQLSFFFFWRELGEGLGGPPNQKSTGSCPSRQCPTCLPDRQTTM